MKLVTHALVEESKYQYNSINRAALEGSIDLEMSQGGRNTPRFPTD